MFPDLKIALAQERVKDLRASSRRASRGHRRLDPQEQITLRYASAADARRLRHLAELDSATAPTGSALIAEVDGRIAAALPLDGGAPIADPFDRSAELVDLLRLRAAQLGLPSGAGARA